MADRDTAVHQCQQQVKAAQEKGDKDAELEAWNELGQLRLQQGQYSESIECYHNLARVAKELKNSVLEGRAYYNIAIAYNSLNRYAESVEYHHKCINTIKEKGDDNTVTMAYYYIGFHYNETIQYLENSVNMAVADNDRYVEMRCRHNLGKLYLMFALYEKAIPHFKKIILHSQQTGDVLEPVQNIEYKLSHAFHACGKYKEAFKHHKQSLEYAIQNDNKNMQKEAYKRLGFDCKVLNDYSKAVEFFQEYQNIAKLTGDKEGEVEGYRFTGMAYSEINNHEAALECFQNSLRIAIEIQDKTGEEYGHSTIARAFNELGQYQKAIDHFEQSLLYSIEREDRKEEGETYMRIGKAYIELGSLEQGIEYLNKCLVTSSKTCTTKKQLILWHIGEAHNTLGNYKEAIESYEKFLSLAVETENKRNQENAIWKLGTLYGKLNYDEKAIEYLEKILCAAKNEGDRLKEASVSVNLGNVYVNVAKYDEALEILNKGLNIAVEKEDIELQCIAHVNIAKAYSVLGNDEQYIQHANKGVELGRKCGGKKDIVIYSTLINIALKAKDLTNMLKYAKKKLELVENLKSSDKYEQLQSYLDIGKACYLTGNFKDAGTYFEKSLDLANKTGNREKAARAFEHLGYVYGRQHTPDSYEKYLECYKEQLKISNDVGDKAGVGKAYRNLGIFFLFQYLKTQSKEQKIKGEHHFKESLRSFNHFLQNVGEEDQRKIDAIETFLFVYKLLVQLYIAAGELENALLVSEEERGRALEDILKRRYRLDETDKPNYDFLGYTDIEGKILLPNTCILFYSSMPSISHGVDSNSELQELIGTWVLDFRNPVFYCHIGHQQIKTLLQGGYLSEDEHGSKDVLSPLIDNACLTMARGIQRSANYENRSFVTSSYTDSGKQSYQASYGILRCAFDEFKDLELNKSYLEVLYEILIAPVQDKLIHEEIVIVPNGPLFKVPFAALRNPQTDSFLVETKRVRIVPSLTTLKILKESSAESHSLTGALIVGNPDVHGKRMLRGKERSFHSLPNAQLEAERIGEVLGVKALTGKQASKQVIIERLRQGVAVIHFAAHGCAETGEIILAPPQDHPADKIPDEEDYLLTISEVQQTGLRARLVVLSCCHSGRGEIKSEGVINNNNNNNNNKILI